MKITAFIFGLIITGLNYGYSQLNFECETQLKLYPKNDDFGGGKEGRVLISSPDGVFHSNYQTEESHIEIKASLPIDKLNSTVYFRVVDIEDKSSYVQGQIDDNVDSDYGIEEYDDMIFTNQIVYKKIANNQEVILGVDRAIAKVKLRITDQNSGDNYKVIASLDINFNDQFYLDETADLIAWKRMNYQISNMFSQGGTLGVNFPLNSDFSTLRLFRVDDTEFGIGDEILVWDNLGNSETTTITNIVQQLEFTNISTTGLANTYAEFSGVRKNDGLIDFSIKDNMITNAYGEDSKGIDGGVFIEWVEVQTANNDIPKFDPSKLMGEEQTRAIQFSNAMAFWTDSNNENNVIKLIKASYGLDSDNIGFHVGDNNFSIVAFESISSIFNLADQNTLETIASSNVIHEFAHHFDVASDHVDTFLEQLDHEHNEHCILSYLHEHQTEHVEFDNSPSGCINDIRNAINPR